MSRETQRSSPSSLPCPSVRLIRGRRILTAKDDAAAGCSSFSRACCLLLCILCLIPQTARQECLAPLLALGMHHRIFTMMRSVDRDIQAASADTGGAGDGDGDGDGGSRSQRENLLYATMLAGVRTLRTFYSALVAYVDPLASDSFTYDMVVKSSLAKMEAMGTKLDLPFASTPTPSSNPRHQAAGPSSSKMQIVETTSKSTTMDFEDVASEVADSVFLVSVSISNWRLRVEVWSDLDRG